MVHRVHWVRWMAVTVIGVSAAGAAWADQVDQLVRAEMARQHIPGLSIAVVKNGRIIKEAGYGLANIEHKVAVTPQTIFQSGSVGKQFTAALVMLLTQDGKLRLDAPVSTYLPDAPSAWTGITIRHLLTHTAGLAPENPAQDLRKDFSEDELWREIARLPLQSAPGEKWAYSNLGYQVLGIICSRVGGKFYGDQLRERIFDPAQMQARMISERDIVPHRAAGYERVDGVLRNQQWVSPSANTTADGSLYLTAHDLAHWSIALEGDKVLSASIKQASWTPARLNDGSATQYGFGWMVGDFGGHRFVQHSGAWQGFTSHIARYLDDRLTVVVLANRSQAAPMLIADQIAGHYIPALAPPKNVPPTAATYAKVPVYLRGSMNDWGVSERLQSRGRDVYESRLELDAGQHSFKISSEDWNTIDLGARFDEEATRAGAAKALETKGGNLQLAVPRRAAYVFRLDVSRAPQLTVSLAP
jgi:CubicO group peptidase (beta-lactamase class C family)